MSLRVLAAVLCVILLMAYAWSPGWRRLRPGWLFSTCGAVVMMAVLERPDMPRSIGIPGINLWNILMINNVIAWLSRREWEGYDWDLPQQIKIRGLLFCGVMLVAFLRVLIEAHPLAPLHGFNAFAAYFINCFKWLIPGLILFDGCRHEGQIRNALLLVLSTYVLIALQTIKTVPISAVGSGDELSQIAGRRIRRDVGYHRIDVSMMLAGATWAIYCCSGIFQLFWQRLIIWMICGITLLGQALTGGRMGYVALLGIGLILALAKWRKLLLLGPAGLMVLIAFVPSVRERMMMGFAQKQGAIVVQQDTNEITAGRSGVWPITVEQIMTRPILGWGRAGFQTSGLELRSLQELGEKWPHPHNAYLEYLLDNGLVGFLLSIPIYITIIIWSFHFLRKKEALPSAVGGVVLSLFLALLFSSMGAQTLYTRESVVMMWAIAGLLIRLWLEYDKVAYGEETDFFDESKDLDFIQDPEVLHARVSERID